MGGLTPAQSLSLYEGANPFNTPAALRFSSYSACIDGVLVRLLDWKEPAPQAKMADKALRGFLLGDGFSCVAGKAAVRSAGYRFGYYPGFPATQATAGLARDLAAFVSERPSMPARYATFVAVFEELRLGSERAFEAALWEQLRRLHELDAPHFEWDPAASKDPADPRFGFSFAGAAFFVVGMHANASRASRRFFLPALAFNLHSQFDASRKNGQYTRIQSLVREREMNVQGSINPELAEFGTASEARQYSGRRTEGMWTCPFAAHS
jgi:hypothetical protein